MSIFIFQKKEKRNIESNFNFQKESLIFSPTIINQRSRKRGINTEHIYTFKAIYTLERLLFHQTKCPWSDQSSTTFFLARRGFIPLLRLNGPATLTVRARFYTPPLTKHNAIFLPRLPPQFYSTCQTGRGSCTLVRPNNSSSPGERPPPTIYSMF